MPRPESEWDFDWDETPVAPEGFYYDAFGELIRLAPPDPYSYVVAMDPGGTTGLACLRYKEDTPPELIYLHQIEDGKVGFFDWFCNSFPESNVAIVSEKWVEHDREGVDRTPLVIEGVQYAIWLDRVVYQEPGMKSLVPDEWLKEQNLWVENKRHAMDALIHAFVYLRNQEHKPTQKALTDELDETIAEPGEAESKVLPESPQDEAGDGGDESASSAGEDASEDGEEGDGGGQPSAEALAAMVAAMAAMGQAASEAAEAAMDMMQELQAGDEPEEKSQESGGAHGGIVDTKYTGTRKKRALNGAFSGYDSESDEESVLYVD